MCRYYFKKPVLNVITSVRVCENSLMLMSLFYVIILDMSNIAK